MLNCRLLGQSRKLATADRPVDQTINVLFERVDTFQVKNRNLLAAHQYVGPDTGTLLSILRAIPIRNGRDRFQHALRCVELATQRWGWQQIENRAVCYVLSLAVRDAIDAVIADTDQEIHQHRLDRRQTRPRPILVAANERLFKQVTDFIFSSVARPFLDRLQDRQAESCWPKPGSWADALATEDLARWQHERLMAFQLIGMLRRLGLKDNFKRGLRAQRSKRM